MITAFGSQQFFEFAYRDGARFVLDNAATRLWATSCPPVSIDYLATYIRGPIMGFALRRRGLAPLHAGAAKLGNHAIAICGPVESGKSTTVAALASRGIPILSDDITALQQRKDAFYVEPGYPWVCLWPDSVLNLFGSQDALPRLTSDWEKRYLPLQSAGFEATRQPISAIYFLAPRRNESSAPRLEYLTAREGLLELVKNTYMNWLLDGQQRATEFNVLTQLASAIAFRRLIPHADPSCIGPLCDLIIRDCESRTRFQEAFTALPE